MPLLCSRLSEYRELEPDFRLIERRQLPRFELDQRRNEGLVENIEYALSEVTRPSITETNEWLRTFPSTMLSNKSADLLNRLSCFW